MLSLNSFILYAVSPKIKEWIKKINNGKMRTGRNIPFAAALFAKQ